MDRHGHNCEILLYTQFSNEHFFLCVFLQIVDLLSYNLDVSWMEDFPGVNMDRPGHNCEILLYTQFSNEHFFLCSYKLLIFYPIIWMLVGMEVGQTMLVVWLHAPAGHTRAGAHVAEAG